jgi:hypothetical protein
MERHKQDCMFLALESVMQKSIKKRLEILNHSRFENDFETRAGNYGREKEV